MNRQFLLALGGLFVSSPAFAQNLQDQINAVDTTIAHQQADETAVKAKAEKRLQVKLAAQQAQRDQDKKRNQGYEDKIRDMQLEDASLDLDAKRARVKRVNEYIDQDLKEQAAHTDVVQSEADAVRNVSSGVGENLKSLGRASEEEAKSKK